MSNNVTGENRSGSDLPSDSVPIDRQRFDNLSRSTGGPLVGGNKDDVIHEEPYIRHTGSIGTAE